MLNSIALPRYEILIDILFLFSYQESNVNQSPDIDSKFQTYINWMGGGGVNTFIIILLFQREKIQFYIDLIDFIYEYKPT